MAKNIPNARERILKTAIQIFAQKSFEGSRVDEIARKAGVPKSLIYYHFKSKEDILQALHERLLNEYKILVSGGVDETHQEKAEKMESKRDNYTAFMKENADLIRIIFIESLKKSNKAPSIYKIVETLMQAEQQKSPYSRQPGYNNQERLVAEFFTNIIPGVAFLCFHESFQDYFNIEAPALEQLFWKVFKETHGAYHKAHD